MVENNNNNYYYCYTTTTTIIIMIIITVITIRQLSWSMNWKGGQPTSLETPVQEDKVPVLEIMIGFVKWNAVSFLETFTAAAIACCNILSFSIGV